MNWQNFLTLLGTLTSDWSVNGFISGGSRILPEQGVLTDYLAKCLAENYMKTRMHSSRMRTGRSLTVCCSLFPGGCLVRGVCSWGSVCLVRLGGTWSGGVPGRGGAWTGGCLLWGDLLPGGSARGVSAPGGVCARGGIPACTEADTPPPVDRQTFVKILPWPNFIAAGNKKAFQ